jgi:tetratricopeptide (TPR) repeat protein
LVNLVHVQRNLAEPAAGVTYARAIALLEASLGRDHPDVAEALDGLAHLELKDNHGDKAVPLFRRALRIREEKLGPDHTLTAETLDGLAVSLRSVGHEVEAVDLQSRAAEIRRKHPREEAAP